MIILSVTYCCSFFISCIINVTKNIYFAVDYSLDGSSLHCTPFRPKIAHRWVSHICSTGIQYQVAAWCEAKGVEYCLAVSFTLRRGWFRARALDSRHLPQSITNPWAMTAAHFQLFLSSSAFKYYPIGAKYPPAKKRRTLYTVKKGLVNIFAILFGQTWGCKNVFVLIF